ALIPVQVGWSTTGGGAFSGVDFQSASGTVSFALGESSKTITVLVYGDNIDELNETFTVNLNWASSATIGDGYGVGTIVDDDPVPVMTISGVTLVEGGLPNTSSTVPANFTVSLSNPSSSTVTVSFVVLAGTATAGSDYQDTYGSIGIPAGQTTGTITVNVIQDIMPEADEAFQVRISSPSGATFGGPSYLYATGTILNDDTSPAFAI